MLQIHQKTTCYNLLVKEGHWNLKFGLFASARQDCGLQGDPIPFKLGRFGHAIRHFVVAMKLELRSILIRPEDELLSA